VWIAYIVSKMNILIVLIFKYWMEKGVLGEDNPSPEPELPRASMKEGVTAELRVASCED
jgi:hypothetical protein